LLLVNKPVSADQRTGGKKNLQRNKDIAPST
jgi:hypothetical protein